MSAWAEASVPCGLRLGGSVALAVDRRVSCRAASGDGLELESKDALTRLQLGGAEELSEAGPLGWLKPLLLGLGAGPGLRLVTQARVPETTGLGVRPAVAAALVAALLAWRGRPVGPESVAAVLREHLPGLAPLESWTALLGGVVGLNAGGVGERLPADPACLEERLLLVEAGLEAAPEAAPSEPVAEAGGDEALRAALRAGAYRDLAAALPGRSGSGVPDVAAAGLAERARALGGGAWRLCPPRGGLLALYAEPDARRELLAAARQAGLKPVSCRLDLLGLDLEVGDQAGSGRAGLPPV